MGEQLTVVGIGASAGGLQALKAFFASVPADGGMAYVVIMHLDPERESHAAELLQQRAVIPVTQVTEAVALEPDRAYVIPHDRDLHLQGGMLRLQPRDDRGLHAPIDLFFRTLAAACGRTAVGVVLSGTGADGTLGLRLIKEAGGVTVAQAPEDAEFDAMPRSAISTGQVDMVLPAASIPGELVRLNRGDVRLHLAEDRAVAGSAEDEAAVEHPDESLRLIFARLRAQTGHDFSEYKRATVLRRVDRRMRFIDARTIEEYRERLREDPGELRALFKDLLISVSGFFRDPEAFHALQQNVVPGLFEGKGPQDQIRVWVSGCATGEEAYSLAVLLAEHASTLDDPPAIQLFATDIDESACMIARAAHYPSTVAAEVDPERLARFFITEAGGYKVVRRVRDLVLVAKHDLLRDPPFSRIDLISCRNLLIYLRPEAQSRVLEIFRYALRPDGYLFLGSSESADSGADLFAPVDRRHRIYGRRADAPARIPVFTSAAVSTQHGDNVKPSARPRFSYGALHLRMLEAYAPPSLVVDKDHAIVHLSEQAGRFLRIAGGEPTRNLIDLVPEHSRRRLRTALYSAFRKRRRTRHRVRLETPDGDRSVDVIVRPLEDDDATGRFALVLFEEHVEPAAEEDRFVAPFDGEDIAALRDEVHRARLELQETVEERESTIRELYAANEDLQSINEEQKAATEELETSREELQSANEELATVNQELRSINEQLRHVNADLQNLIDATQIGTIFLDRDLRVRRFTPTSAELFNLIETDLGRPLSDMSHGLRYAGLIQDAQHVLTSLDRVAREVESEDGKWYTLRIIPYRSVEDRIIGVVVSFFDITRQKGVEFALLEVSRRAELEHARLAALMEQLTAAVLIAEVPSGRIVSVNKRYRELLQDHVPADEPIDAHTLARIAAQPDGTPYPLEAWPIARAIRDGVTVMDEEVKIQLRDGRRLTILVSAVPVQVRDDAIDAPFATMIVATMTDISARAKMEAELREAQAAAEAANRVKSIFLSSISHELSTPLNAILGYADVLLLMGTFSEQERQRLERIKMSSRHLAGLIEQLLNFAKLDEGRETVRVGPVDARLIAGEAAAIVEPLATEKELLFHLDLPAEAVDLHTDGDKLRQILVNLLGNAVKYTERGEVRLVLRTEGERIIFHVRDTGIGIAPENYENVFQRFWQLKGGATRQRGGVGIGLAVVRGLSRLLGGDVAVQSELGAGSTFTVRLPRRIHPDQA